MIIERIAREGPCPECGVLSSAVMDRPLMQVKDLPACDRGPASSSLCVARDERSGESTAALR
jgi:hypothetical protein